MVKLSREYAWRARNRRVVVPLAEVVSDDMKASADDGVTVVAYHTDDEFYTHEAKRMCASAERLDIRVKTTTIPNQGGWEANTSFKSAYLLRERDLVNGPMLYVDVDAVFHVSPLKYLAGLDCDMAVYYDLGDGHLVSATLFLQDTDAVRHLLAEWNRQCIAHPEIWDQEVLQSVIAADQASVQPRYKVVHLPVGFCWIFDREDNLRAPKQQVYIEQLQAARMVHENLRTRGKLFSIRKSKVQRRMDRIREIEDILFRHSSDVSL
ncbi:putative nucleotide-diphospho-sugar transferase [Snodgrassella alvi]|jgi:hypothetical protein|uniref:putative nucleotide-diphospho-sugar transferase n=1 Tax=Snodgrassella alvi TaxID=1196083 RepID=UPI000C1EC197|nr:putative nucleotide-diphospho-sugar transferase [Snodgrassella alvi]